MSEKNTTSAASGGGGTPAACTTGSCPCKPIASISLVSLTFRSDHDLLKDYSADWKDGGSRFPKPEWTPAKQVPISHSLDKAISVRSVVRGFLAVRDTSLIGCNRAWRGETFL